MFIIEIPFNSYFFQNAIIIGLLLAFIAALLSPFLVLKKESLLSDGIAHSAFLGFSISLFFKNHPLWIAVLTAVSAGFLIKLFIKKTLFQSDDTIGIISNLFLAIGLILISINDGLNTNISQLIRGDINAIKKSDIIIGLVVFSITYLFILVFYKKLLLLTFDYDSAGICKIYKEFLDYALTILVSVVVVIGVRIVGAFLIASIIIFPSLIARNLRLNFRYTLVAGCIISLITFFLGIVLAHILNIPASAFITVLFFIDLVVSLIYKKVRSKI